jgi:molybdate transport system substrate-binding protein
MSRGMIGNADRRARAAPRRITALASVAIGGLVLAIVSCGSSGTSAGSHGQAISGKVVVFADTALEGAFDAIGPKFQQAHPAVAVTFDYADSLSLATRLSQGRKADVFAAAGAHGLTVAGERVTTGGPRVLASDKLVIVVGLGNPKGITTVSDLERPGIRVVECDPDMPCSAYSRTVFTRSGVTVRPAAGVSGVGAVIAKVAKGHADAGIVYVSDVKSGGCEIGYVPIPAGKTVTVRYQAATVKDARNPAGARAFISYALSPAGQKVLAKYGLEPPGG